MKRIFSVSMSISILVVLSILAAMTITAVAETPQRGGSIIIAYGGNYVADPDPQRESNEGELSIANMMAEPLVGWDEEGHLRPVLAKSWEMSADGKTYTFHLRDGVLFHNGVPLTAEAVKWSIERVKDPANALPMAGQVANVESVATTDKLTVCLHLTKPDPDLPGKLANVYITEPGSYKGRGADDPVAGTGPFKLVPGKYERDRQMVLEKFPQYWGGEPFLDQITVRLVPSTETAVVELERGAVDFLILGVFPVKEAKRLQAEGYKPYIWGAVNWANLAINLKTVDDVALRRAMCYAIDHQVLIDSILGIGELQKNLGYPGSWLENTDVTCPCCNPEKARQILDKAGYIDTNGDGIREKDGKDIVLLFRAPDSGDWLRGSQLIQQMLLQVGIGTKLVLTERHMFYDQVRTGDYDIAWWFQNSTPTPPIALYSWDSRDYWSIHQVELSQFQSLIEAAEGEMDRAKRASLYKEIQRIFDENAYGCLGIWTKQVYVGAPSLHGVKVTPEGQLYNAHLWWKG